MRLQPGSQVAVVAAGSRKMQSLYKAGARVAACAEGAHGQAAKQRHGRQDDVAALCLCLLVAEKLVEDLKAKCIEHRAGVSGSVCVVAGKLVRALLLISSMYW